MLLFLQDLELRLESLNRTVLAHSEFVREFNPILNGKDTAAVVASNSAVPDENLHSSDNDDSYFFSDDIVNEEVDFANGNIDYVTPEFLEKQLETLRRNLSITQQNLADLNLNNEESQFQNSNAYTTLSSSTVGDVDIDMLNHLQTNVDVLNTSVAVQGSMLQQAIRAMGEYDRR